jgi:hypothetical protein
MSNKPGEITYHVVPGTGTSLPIRKVSYVLIQDVQKQVEKELPKPHPPMVKVNYGSGEELEANPADPLYMARLDEWKARFNELNEERTRRLLIKVGVIPFLDWDEGKLAEVKALREMMQEDQGVELDKNDKFVWVTRIAMGSVEDWQEFITLLTRRSLPTEQAVQEHL